MQGGAGPPGPKGAIGMEGPKGEKVLDACAKYDSCVTITFMLGYEWNTRTEGCQRVQRWYRRRRGRGMYNFIPMCCMLYLYCGDAYITPKGVVGPPGSGLPGPDGPDGPMGFNVSYSTTLCVVSVEGMCVYLYTSLFYKGVTHTISCKNYDYGG